MAADSGHLLIRQVTAEDFETEARAASYERPVVVGIWDPS